MKVYTLRQAAAKIYIARHCGLETARSRALHIGHIKHEIRSFIREGINSENQQFRNLRTGCTNFNRSMRKHLNTERYPYGYTLAR